MREWRQFRYWGALLVLCLSCGESLAGAETLCKNCGFRTEVRHSGSAKSRVTTAWLAILFGSLGAHWFYLGKASKAFPLMLIAPIAAVLGVVKGVGFLKMSNSEFSEYLAENL